MSMKLRMVSGCENGTCPAVYVSDRGTAVVQGFPVDNGTEGLNLGYGEAAVELPPDVVLEAVSALATAQGKPEAAQRIREALTCS